MKYTNNNNNNNGGVEGGKDIYDSNRTLEPVRKQMGNVYILHIRVYDRRRAERVYYNTMLATVNDLDHARPASEHYLNKFVGA